VVFAKLAHSQLFPNSGLPAGTPGKTQANGLAGNTGGAVVDVILWGLVVAVAGGVDLLLARRFRRQRWLIWGGGVIVVLVLLYFFFNAITPLLPASF
jgi:hypothetical protein